ncbi:MAG: ATP phosphoribosyltransferase [Candidatus Nanopelagicaceae bacterium]|jgi:ATP phosphoribosyltransferase|nr:ATP phosphoribosyltransferase [Actinomycetota bacterium]
MTLKIALPNKGSLSDAATSILKEAGYRQRTDSRDLVFYDPSADVEFYYLRPRDIAVYVGSGELEIGITGRDLLIDSGAEAEEILGLDFGKSRFRFAARNELQLSDLSGKRIATAYPGLVSHYLAQKGLKALVVKLDGAVESSIQLGVADVIADVVSTGGTLKQAGLVVFGDPILESEAIVIKRKGAQLRDDVATLIRRLQGVVIARQYVLVDYDVEEKNLEAACKVTPGLESPTISPLQKSGWVAVRAMVTRSSIHHVMDDLYGVGARGILVTDIHASRL